MSLQVTNTSPIIESGIDSKKDLIKRQICKGATDDEFELFIHLCKRTGLDPFMKQIYMIPRWSNAEKRNTMMPQTSIDGFRLIAERTGKYAPGRESTHTYDKDNNLLCTTSYVKKQTSDGSWHEVAASAYFSEYAQRNKEGVPTQFWQKMPHQMLAKCAESLALRKAFPAEMSGIYTQEEMSQAMPVVEEKGLNEEQQAKLDLMIMDINDEDYLKKLADFLKVESLYDITAKDYDRTMRSLENKIRPKQVENGQTNVA